MGQQAGACDSHCLKRLIGGRSPDCCRVIRRFLVSDIRAVSGQAGFAMNLSTGMGSGMGSLASLWALRDYVTTISRDATRGPDRRGRGPRAVALAGLLALAACSPASPPAEPAPAGGEWREFQGTWTAAGSRHTMRLGADRQASIASLNGSLLLAGPSRPGVGFRAEAIVLNDSASGMVGRSVWTDERGDQVFSELRGEGTATGNRITGTILGGTGRYSGATGSYEFSWRFVLETEDGTVQGQSVGLKGRVRTGPPPAAPATGGPRP